MESFSKKVKSQLMAEEIKKKCCRYTANAVLELGEQKNAGKYENIAGKLAEIFEKCRCSSCKAVYMRMLFYCYGSVTDPEKQYHLDFLFRYAEERDVVADMLESLGFTFKKTTRRAREVLYIKESAVIEDFLVFIGANNAAFDVMNSKIVHEVRNSANRQVNCDTANIEKQLASVKKYTEAIRFLTETGRIATLPEQLRQTAKLRLENEQLSLSDLGKMFDPPVSKSGIKHRLDKILDYAENFCTQKTCD